eukprot:TRINITY_DN3078_c5_g9_i1.p1 TRINITY_DN3078_c5_g9~~TRINITY_DN3078_c5_g9_i1.p1  ORF type:complete len:140 (-),score=39.47 TRINITY_DN3078_c5_g9_i1:31-450(-)
MKMKIKKEKLISKIAEGKFMNCSKKKIDQRILETKILRHIILGHDRYHQKYYILRGLFNLIIVDRLTEILKVFEKENYHSTDFDDYLFDSTTVIKNNLKDEKFGEDLKENNPKYLLFHENFIKNKEYQTTPKNTETLTY